MPGPSSEAELRLTASIRVAVLVVLATTFIQVCYASFNDSQRRAEFETTQSRLDRGELRADVSAVLDSAFDVRECCWLRQAYFANLAVCLQGQSRSAPDCADDAKVELNVGCPDPRRTCFDMEKALQSHVHVWGCPGTQDPEKYVADFCTQFNQLIDTAASNLATLGMTLDYKWAQGFAHTLSQMEANFTSQTRQLADTLLRCR